ncbi:phage tail protein [Flavobacterium sp. ARAG 55.4]|uniref:phage tail protein n=1 Tax=Flavobacterium sp. ARAG 55.4 TaxID=3451357 RepID=UPI003F446939
MEFFVSQIICLATNVSPKGFMKCEGQTLETADYPALFSVIGINYGGNGTTNFKLPDLRDRSIVHQSATKLLGAVGGSSSVQLSQENLPSHQHDSGTLKTELRVSDESADESVPGGMYIGLASASLYTETLTGTSKLNGFETSGNTGSVGASESVDIQNPYLAMNYFISLYGVLPVQE